MYCSRFFRGASTIDMGVENGIGVQSSNHNLVCCIHFSRKYLWERHDTVPSSLVIDKLLSSLVYQSVYEKNNSEYKTAEKALVKKVLLNFSRNHSNSRKGMPQMIFLNH